jgi:hypothetical protein
MANTIRTLALALTLTLPGFLPSAVAADSDRSGEAAMGHGMDPDELEGGSENPDDLTGRSEDPDDRTVGSEDPDDMVVGAEDPDGLVGKSTNPDARVGTSTDLSALQESDDSENLLHSAPERDAEVSPPGPNATASVLAAWSQVQSAEFNLKAADGVYEDMIANDYPRGERRARIIEERNDAVEAVNRARERYTQLQGG